MRKHMRAAAGMRWAASTVLALTVACASGTGGVEQPVVLPPESVVLPRRTSSSPVTGGGAAGGATQGTAGAGAAGPAIARAGSAAPATGAPAPSPASGAAGVGPGSMTAAGAAAPGPRGEGTCLLAGDGSYGEPGPYQVGTMDVTIGASGPFTIFYPMPLEADCLHPIVSWGNGSGVTGSAVYAFFNANAAAWGMVVAAAHDPAVGSGAFNRDGIDWLLAQNEDSSSMFYQKLSTRAGTGGHSQGGFGATVASTHPNVEAEVCVAGGGVVEAKVAFMCLTGTADFVNAPCTSSYQSAPGPSFLADWNGGDHFVTETLAGYSARDPGTLQMQRLYAAWFRCFLADDSTACTMFSGSPCGICSDMGWARIEGKNI